MGGVLYCTLLISIGSGLIADAQLEPDEEADAFEGVLVGMGTKSGSVDAVVAVPVGSTKAMSPFGNRVGTKCTLVPLELLKRIPLGCGSGCGGVSTSTGFGSICTCT